MNNMETQELKVDNEFVISHTRNFFTNIIQINGKNVS